MVSVRRVAPVLLLAMTIPAFAAVKKSSSHPPRELHHVDNHSTAYEPPDPATYPAGAKTYTIKQGDTLWGIAGQLFKSPYLWPQLWEANTWITDAHWIYPGDVLLVEGEAANAAAAATAASSGGTDASATNTATTALPTVTSASNSSTTTTTTTTTTLSSSSDNSVMQMPAEGPTSAAAKAAAALDDSRPVALGTEFDVYCAGYIGDPNEPMPNRVSSFEDAEVLYQPGVVSQDNGVSFGDLVYIDGGTATGLIPGETYLIVEPKESISHPKTGALIGKYYDFRGRMRILCADATHARGMITDSCKEVHIGARLKPIPQIPIPIVRVPPVASFCDPSSGKTNGYIVHSDGWTDSLADGNIVMINLGKDDQLQPGDFLTVYRESPVPGQPRQVLGQIGVLTTESHTATARIMQTRRSMEIGDHVEVR